MKRIETVSINGILFSIDGEACCKLNEYLDTLNEYFKHEHGGNEIIADIEARIAELFTERHGGVSQAITCRDVLHVIETLGSLEDITDAESGGDDSPSYDGLKQHPKRLYRDTDRRIAGGVCAGIASWLGISVLVVRLVFCFCLLFYAISLLVYFMLWLIIPAAKTTAQKLEMQGQPVNISNIEKSIRESVPPDGMKQSFEQFGSEANETVHKLFRVIFIFLRIVAGIALCAIGISTVLLCCGLHLFRGLFFFDTEWDSPAFYEFLRHIISPVSYNILVICLILSVSLTVFGFLYWGIKLIARFEVHHVKLHIALFIIWLLSIPVGAFTVAGEAGNFKWRGKTEESTHINACDTLYLSVNSTKFKMPNIPKIYYDSKNSLFYGKPDMFIRKSLDGKIKIDIIKSSRGKSRYTAFEYAENIGYNIDIRDSQIIIPQYFTVEPQTEWRFQQLDVILYIPENTVVIVDRLLCHADIIVNPRRSGHDGNVCKWVMTQNGIMAAD
jgi:phage shock protein PspC (stress-responsive transcriptional regulator)